MSINSMYGNEEDYMLQHLAHITQSELPGFWLAALIGFAAGVTITYGMLARTRMK